MSLNLTSETKSGLSLLSTFTPLIDKPLVSSKFLDHLFHSLISSSLLPLPRTKEIPDLFEFLPNADELILKQIHTALYCLLLEAAKFNLVGADISSVLTERKVPESFIESIAVRFDDQRAAIRVALSVSTSKFPHIIGIEWRLDYQLKTNSLERVDAAMYFVTLKTRSNDDQDTDIKFTCTLEQLQDLANKIRDASKQFDRILAW
eukprot:TRINITY_DN7263_c0_g1_i1.p1 TRINITY_DN7263_c0_g1~~TRINITY_DN7263_c0_g1_i1.p1  ORF type:complete len:205 (+),score=72.46 TRINITY_DN7263_c0_g1_i1:83-697(+)